MKNRNKRTQSIQRRELVRIDCRIPAKFYKHDTNDLDRFGNQKVYDGMINNLSSGGIRFFTNIPLNPDEFVHIVFEIDGKELDSSSIIINSSECSERGWTYECRSKFFSISQSQQDKIMKFIFGAQSAFAHRKLNQQ